MRGKNGRKTGGERGTIDPVEKGRKMGYNGKKTQEASIMKERAAKKGSGGNKPFWKKWWFWVIVVVAVVAISSNAKIEDSPDSEPVADVSKEQPTEKPIETGKPIETEKADEGEKPAQKPQKTDDTEKVIKRIKKAIKGTVGENEVIKDVVLENRDLKVRVDIAKADLPSPLTIEDLAVMRTSSITDKILNIKEYDELWDTITVDFGKTGSIKNGKDNIKDSEAGRYFKSVNFKLKK